MNKTNVQTFTTARAHLALGNGGAYARLVSSAHRSAATKKEQAAIIAEIANDGMQTSVTMLPNGCLVEA